MIRALLVVGVGDLPQMRVGLAAAPQQLVVGEQVDVEAHGRVDVAVDDDVVDDVLTRMRAVAQAFPPGTVLGRVGGGVVVRRAPPV